MAKWQTNRRQKRLHTTGGLAQSGQWLARKFVQIWKFCARPNGSESPCVTQVSVTYASIVNLIKKSSKLHFAKLERNNFQFSTFHFQLKNAIFAFRLQISNG